MERSQSVTKAARESDAQVVCVDPALAYANVELLTNAKVTRLDTDASGREVTRVLVEREGEPEEYSADLVVLSCGAINSAALLLRSANDKHPRGLANEPWSAAATWVISTRC